MADQEMAGSILVDERNDVDTDQRRRTLDSAGAMPLTEPFIEGSQKRA
jgi:hypothetical protein